MPKPSATNTSPSASLNRAVMVSFSIVINTPSAAIHTTFIAPTANITIIVAQQQPRQTTPCRSPSRSTPIGSVVQFEKKNGNGRWQSLRHACLSVEN